MPSILLAHLPLVRDPGICDTRRWPRPRPIGPRRATSGPASVDRILAGKRMTFPLVSGHGEGTDSTAGIVGRSGLSV
jgi:hypothetical protein